MRTVLLYLISLSIFAVSPQLYGQKGNPVYLGPEEFMNNYRMEVFAIMLDVRLKKEYRKERISGATNVDNMKTLVAFADTLDTETPLYLYCNTYTRSNTVAEYLVKNGFSNVFILKDGLLEWKAAGLPVEKRGSRKK